MYENKKRYLEIIESERRAKTLHGKIDPFDIGLNLIRAGMILLGVAFVGGIWFAHVFA